MAELNLSDIQLHDFPSNQYYRVETPKNQLVVHHTVSGPGALGDINWWKQTSARIATHLIVTRDGGMHQCYSSRYWGHHLGVKGAQFDALGIPRNNTGLNKASVAIELDSWGGLTMQEDEWHSGTGKLIPDQEVVTYPDGFRGFKGFEKYTDAQIESLRQLLVFLGNKYNIPLGYHEDQFQYSEKALKGAPGLYTHVSYRKDKSDCHPQQELIDMFKGLGL